jgi:hypothetical protein
MWPLAAGLPRKPEPPPPPELDAAVYVYAAASPGKCLTCGVGYGLGEVVVCTGASESNTRRIVHLACHEEAA